MKKQLFIAVLCMSMGAHFMVFATLPRANARQFHVAKNNKKHHSSSSSEQKTYTGPRVHKSNISPWIEKKGDVFVYKLNVFNLAEESVCMHDLKSMMKAQEKDSWENYRKESGCALDIKVYPAKEVHNPKLFNGDRIPFFLVETSPDGGLAFHWNNPSEPASSESFLWAGGTIYDTLGITVPSNLPPFTPYGAVDVEATRAFIARAITNNNPWINKNLLQQLSISFNHEFKEIMGDDSVQNMVNFDTFAPTVATWHYGEFDENGVCTNGTVGPDGYVHLPLFNDVFPAGGLFFSYQENCDPVEIADVIASYHVDGWTMVDNVNSNYWKGYYLSNKIKWDKTGIVENPLQPFVGEQDQLFFLDFDTGITLFGVAVNFGPETYSQRGASVQNNFPPDYTFVRFFFDFSSSRGGQGDAFLKNYKFRSPIE